MTLFHHVEKEIEWRREHGKAPGFEGLRACHPILAVGATGPLADQRMMADYFRELTSYTNLHRADSFWQTGSMALVGYEHHTLI